MDIVDGWYWAKFVSLIDTAWTRLMLRTMPCTRAVKNKTATKTLRKNVKKNTTHKNVEQLKHRQETQLKRALRHYTIDEAPVINKTLKGYIYTVAKHSL